MSRESMSQAVSNFGRRFIVTPLDSVSSCAFYSDRRFDVVVYYSHDPETISLADVTWLRKASPSAGLVVLSDAIKLRQDVVKAVVAQRVFGLILARYATLNMVVSSIRIVASGRMSIAREFLIGDWQPEQQVSRSPTGRSQLTRREIDVLALLKRGSSDNAIANALDKSVSTAKVHVRNPIRKMGATNRTQVAMTADGYLGTQVNSLAQ
jgi:DNA-binding NarL/FixJ family response regulator